MAAGTRDLPTKRTSVRMVTTYGIMEIRFTGITEFEPRMTRRPLQKPNRMQPSIAPCGVNFPKMTAAMAMKPCPITTDGRKAETVARVMDAPPRPARKPERITQI